MDLARSRLFHRLRLLGVAWAVPATSAVRATGTFRETWRLRWEPSLSLAVVEAATWGTTVASAAGAKADDVARGAGLAELTATLERCLAADLPGSSAVLLAALERRAALDPDVVHLMEALPALVRAQRYGDVRGTDVPLLGEVSRAFVLRICTGLGQVVSGLDDEGAAVVRRHVDGVQAAVALLAGPADDLTDRWLGTLRGLVDRADVHGGLVGRMVRLLRDAGRLDDAALRLGRALSVGVPPARGAAWVDGFLADGAVLLLHDTELVALLDTWVRGLDDSTFVDVLPLVRRTFGSFSAPERAAVAERLAASARGTGGTGGTGGMAAAPAADDVERERAEAAVTTVAVLLGVGR